MPLTSSLADTALSITYLAFLVWSITVTGFILHRALSTNLPIGITVAMGILVLSVATSQVAIGSV